MCMGMRMGLGMGLGVGRGVRMGVGVGLGVGMGVSVLLCSDQNTLARFVLALCWPLECASSPAVAFPCAFHDLLRLPT